MFRNYLKVAFRALLKNKVFGFINIAGLAIGISTCVLITLFVLDELSYDTFNEKADRIFRVTEILHLPKEDRPQAVTAPPMAPWLKTNFAEVEKTVRISRSSRILSYKDTKMFDTQIYYADSSLFEIFTFPMLKGNPTKALVNPYSIVLTESAVKKYFGDEDPIGKSMSLSDTIALTVTAVIKDIPTTSHTRFDVVLSRTTIDELNNHEPEDNWFNNGYYSYILLANGSDHKKLEAKIKPALEKQMKAAKKDGGLWYDFVLQPLTDIHLKSTIPYDISPNGDLKYVITFSIIAALVLFIACANYVNLSTARSLTRAKEVGMRKAVGANRSQLVTQLLGESVLVTLIAFLIALAVINVVLPSFNLLTGKNLTFALLFTQSKAVLILVGIFLTIGILAGCYPALFLSSFSPIAALKNKLASGKDNGFVRKGLVVFQFTISIVLIAGTLLIFSQMRFMQNQKLGLNKDQMIMVKMRSALVPKHKLIKDELSSAPGVISSTVTDFSYGSGTSNIALLPEGAGENEITSEAVISIDPNFLKTFQIELVAGRDFSEEIISDDTAGFIVNESAVRHFNWGTPEQALGKKIDWGLGKKGKVVGVVKDFNFSSLHESIRPLILHIQKDFYRFIGLKVNAANVSETISSLEKKWKTLNPDIPFEYSFLNEDFAQLYKSEKQTQTIVGLLSGLAIFIACLGLFGLAAFMAEQRMKEIGVRKVLGADVLGIVGLLSKDFIILVLIAIAIAVPVAWLGMNRWLDGFAYKTDLSWWIFAVAGTAAIVIALVTVSFQSIKAAMTNPAKVLKNE
jgi:putative ABC transport system permease protein